VVLEKCWRFRRESEKRIGYGQDLVLRERHPIGGQGKKRISNCKGVVLRQCRGLCPETEQRILHHQLNGWLMRRKSRTLRGQSQESVCDGENLVLGEAGIVRRQCQQGICHYQDLVLS
jgi:hypothetical protein